MVQRRRKTASVPPLASSRTLVKTWQCWGTRIWESSIYEWEALVVWVQLLRKQVEETVKQNPVDAHGPLALSSSKLQAAKLAVPWYSVCTQSAWNDNESIHGKSRGKGCGSAQLPPTSVDEGRGGVFLQCIIEQKRDCKEGKEVKQGNGWGRECERGSVGCRRVGERERERFHAEWLREAERKQNSLKWNEVKIIQALIKPSQKEGPRPPSRARALCESEWKGEWRARDRNLEKLQVLWTMSESSNTVACQADQVSGVVLFFFLCLW